MVDLHPADYALAATLAAAIIVGLSGCVGSPSSSARRLAGPGDITTCSRTASGAKEVSGPRHQLNIALRRSPHRLRLRRSDRALLVWMTWLRPSLLGLARVVQPDTILRWHRAGFRAFFAAVASFALSMPMRWTAWSEFIRRRDSPGPPEHLSAQMKGWWATILARHGVPDAHKLYLLEAACGAWDHMEEARQTLARGRHHRRRAVRPSDASRSGHRTGLAGCRRQDLEAPAQSLENAGSGTASA
jgi:hypothetical protein